MAICISKDKFITEASIEMAAGQVAYSGWGIDGAQAVVDASDLYQALHAAGHIIDTLDQGD